MRTSAAAAVLIACIAATPWTGTLMASEAHSSSPNPLSLQSVASNQSDLPVAGQPVDAATARAWADTFRFVPAEADAFSPAAQFRRVRTRRHGAAVAAIAVGAVASIAGAAVLVYANRPECRTNESASGCGYGTKVVGGAVLSAGIVGLVAGALIVR
jgi:hypothetical protein